MSDVQRTAGVAGTFPYELRDSSGRLVVPAAAPLLTIHSDPARSQVVAGPTPMIGSGPAYPPTFEPAGAQQHSSWTGTYPASLTAGTYYLSTSTVLTSGEPPYVDADDVLVLASVTGSVSPALLTLTETKAHLNKRLSVSVDDIELAGYIAAVQGIADDLCGPVLPQTFVERYDGDGCEVMLDRYPVLAVLEVKEHRGLGAPLVLAESTADQRGEGYQLEADTGRLIRVSRGGYPREWWTGSRNITVTYTAGRATIPPQLRLGALILLEHLWRTTQAVGATSPTGGGLLSGGTTQATGLSGASYALPHRVLELWRSERSAPGIG